MHGKTHLVLIPLLGIFFSNPDVNASEPDSHAGHDHAAEPVETHQTEHPGEDESSHAADDGHDHGTEETPPPPVLLTPEQRKLLSLELRTAEPGNPARILRLNGEIRLDLEKTARLMPRMPGFVTEVAVREGEFVPKGGLLAKLTSHKLGEYYSDFYSAKELEDLTRSEYLMAERLLEKQAVSEKDFLRYKREYANAGIARRKAEALLNSLLPEPDHPGHGHTGEKSICTEYEIRAPFDGTVIARDIAVGENFAEDNTRTVFVLSDLRELWLDLSATASELAMLRTGEKVSVFPARSGREFSGRIVYVAPVISEETRLGLVRVLLENPDGALRPGEFASGTVRPDAGSPSKTVLVPGKAVLLLSGESVVFVPEGEGFAPRVVVTGKAANGWVPVLSGLKPGEKYVAEGAFELKSILLTSGADPHAGHGH